MRPAAGRRSVGRNGKREFTSLLQIVVVRERIAAKKT
jgi:hypothetical protein